MSDIASVNDDQTEPCPRCHKEASDRWPYLFDRIATEDAARIDEIEQLRAELERFAVFVDDEWIPR